MECRFSRSVETARFDDAVEVLDPVHFVGTEERVAFDVEEEVAGGGSRKHQQPVIGLERTFAIAGRCDALGDDLAPTFAAHLDVGLRLNPHHGLATNAVDPLGEWGLWLRKSGPRGDFD